VSDHWLERPRTLRILWIVFAAILAVTVIAEFVVHPHGVFGIDGSFAFNAWYGFLACVGLILFAKLLGHLVKRPDTYYDYDE
jgi:hypothetical protein